jgi:hypothetical protein
MVHLQGQSQLSEVVLAVATSRCFASRLDCWKKQGNQNAHDRDHHQQLDQREATSLKPWLPAAARRAAAKKSRAVGETTHVQFASNS